jgi:hypothetical protein
MYGLRVVRQCLGTGIPVAVGRRKMFKFVTISQSRQNSRHVPYFGDSVTTPVQLGQYLDRLQLEHSTTSADNLK